MEYDMVFEGGGAKGMVFVGALQELEVRGHSPDRLLGASAGAIMSTLLAAGYSADELSAALNEEENGEPVFLGFMGLPPVLSQTEIKNSAVRSLLRDINMTLVPDFLEESLDDAIATALGNSSLTSRLFWFIEKGGFFAADKFISWFQDKLNSGIYPLDRGSRQKGEPRNFGNMTLAEFYEASGTSLSVVGSDTTDSKLLILNHNTAPDCPVVWAVRMSMSLPLVWNEVVWQPEWGTYRGKDISGHTIVDGGLLSNFPIELFISDLEHITAVMGEKKTSKHHVLGFLIDEELEVPDAPKAGDVEKKFEIGQLKTVERIGNLVNTVLSAHDKIVIDTFERLVVRLPAKGYGTVEFGMTEPRRKALIKAGRDATAAFFDRQAAEPEARFGVLSAESLEIEQLAPIAPEDRIANRILRP